MRSFSQLLPAILMISCDPNPEIATLPVEGARGLIAVVMPEGEAATALAIPLEEGLDEISLPFDRDDQGRIALIQLDCPLAALGLPVGRLPIAAEGRALPEGRSLEATYDGGDVGTFEGSAMLDLRLALPPPACPDLIERRRAAGAEIVFVEAGLQRTIIGLSDGRTIDFESELARGTVFLSAVENGEATLLLAGDGTISTLAGEAIALLPPPLPVRFARMAGNRSDLIVATDSGLLARFWGEPAAVTFGPLGSRLGLAAGESGRALFGSSALPDLIAWDRGAAPVEEEAPAPITALAFRGGTSFAGTSAGQLLLDSALVAQVSANPILAVAPFAGGAAALDESGALIAVSDRGERCELFAIDGVVAADGGPSRMALALETNEVVELTFSEGGLRCP